MSDEQEKTTTATPLTQKRRLVGIAIALIIFAVLMVQATNNGTDDENAQDTNTAEEMTQNDDTVTLSSIVMGYGLDEFADADQAGRVINYSQGKPTEGEGSERLIAQVVDAQEENIVYFATESFDIVEKEVLSSIYKYNTVTNRWERIYKNVFTENEDSSAAFYRVVGRVENNLVLFKDNKANSPGPCSDFYLMSENDMFELVLLNLEDPYGGFTPTTVTEEIRTQAEQNQQECQAAMGI
jgi:hypothetical protein